MNIFLLEDDILQQQRLELIIREILVENRCRLIPSLLPLDQTIF